MIKRKTPLRRSGPIQRKTPLKRGGYKIRSVSKKRSTQLREYSRRRKAFLAAHPICQVWLKENNWIELGDGFFKDQFGHAQSDLSAGGLGAPRSTEVHHRNKRHGSRLNDESEWLAVCRANHERIEQNKSWARAQGFLRNV